MRFLDPKDKSRWLNEVISLRVKVSDKLYSDEYGEYENLSVSAYDENGIYHEVSDVCDIEVF